MEPIQKQSFPRPVPYDFSNNLSLPFDDSINDDSGYDPDEDLIGGIPFHRTRFCYHLDVLCNYHGWKNAAELFRYSGIIARGTTRRSCLEGQVIQFDNHASGWDPHRTYFTDSVCCRVYKRVQKAREDWDAVKKYLKWGIRIDTISYSRTFAHQEMMVVYLERVEPPPGSFQHRLLTYVPTEEVQFNSFYHDTLYLVVYGALDHLHGPDLEVSSHERHRKCRGHVSRPHAEADRLLVTFLDREREAWEGKRSKEEWIEALATETEEWDEWSEDSTFTFTGKHSGTILELDIDGHELGELLHEWTYVSSENVFVPSLVVSEYKFHMLRLRAAMRTIARFVDDHAIQLDKLLWAPHSGLIPRRRCRLLGLEPKGEAWLDSLPS